MGHQSGRPKKKGQPGRSQDSHGATRPEEIVITKVDPIDESVKTLRDKILKLGEQFGVEPGNVQQKLRETLLRHIEKLISQDTVDEICSTEDTHRQNERAKELAETVAKVIRDRLSFLWTIDLPHKGRPLESADRDQMIIEMYEGGMKLADIAAELRSKGALDASNEDNDEQTVGSAYKRAKERQKVALELTQEISQLFDKLIDIRHGTNAESR